MTRKHVERTSSRSIRPEGNPARRKSVAMRQQKGGDEHQPKAISPEAIRGDKHPHEGDASISPRQSVVTSTGP